MKLPNTHNFFLRLGLSVFGLTLPLITNAQTVQSEKSKFVATITSFQTYVAGQANHHYIAAVIHFHNKTTQAVTIGLNRDGSKASDEQGNSYRVVQAYGIGSISGSEVDAKFVIPPKGDSDALMLLSWQGNQIFGVSFDLDMAVKELSKLPREQYEVGPESTLRFSSLKAGLTFALENAPEISKHVVEAGPFTARLTHSKFGKASYSYPVAGDFALELENKTNRPIILAIEHDSISGNDDEGNFYGGPNGPGGFANATGIGLVNREKADPQFVLAPGEVKEILLTVGRGRAKSEGSDFVLNFALEELEVLPSKQIREVRQYSLTFPKIRM